jgi:hypothetical protein
MVVGGGIDEPRIELETDGAISEVELEGSVSALVVLPAAMCLL